MIKKFINLHRFVDLHCSKGFVVLFTVLIASIVLAMTVGISQIALREVVLSASAKEAQYAFFAADTGAECALYWDINKNNFDLNNSTVNTPECAGKQVSNFQNNSPEFSFEFEINNSNCIKVNIDKNYSENNISNTKIESLGYNVNCSAVSAFNPRTIQRAIRVTYPNGNSFNNNLSNLGDDPGNWNIKQLTSSFFFEETFDANLFLRQYWGTSQCSQSYSCNILEDLTNPSNKFARFEWRPWDKRNSSDIGKQRGGAEISEQLNPLYSQQYKNEEGIITQGWDYSGNGYPTINNDIWYSWKFRIIDLSAIEAYNPQNNFKIAGGFIFSQWHHRGSPGFSPLISFIFDNNNINLMLKLPCNDLSSSSCLICDETNNLRCITLKPFVISVDKINISDWHKIALHINWSLENKGFLEFYFDNQLQKANGGIGRKFATWKAGDTKIENISTLQNQFPNFLKFGMYVLGWPNNYETISPTLLIGKKIIVDFDDIRIGQTAKSIGLSL